MVLIMLIQYYIEEIAKALNTKIVQAVDMPGMMFVEYDPPVIEGPCLNQPDTQKYPNIQIRVMVLLHELGHVYHGHTQGRPPFNNKRFYFDNGVLKSEAQAWEFALKQYNKMCRKGLIAELSSITREFVWNNYLGSYYNAAVRLAGCSHRLWNGNRHHVEFVFDKPDDYFWSIKDRILVQHRMAA